MTPNEMDVAIALHTGYEQRMWARDWRGRPAPPALHWFRPGHSYPIEWIPNFSGDLNAMHKAERTLGANARYYEDNLANLFSDGFLSASYTAVQRAEAFLRAVGKWVETEVPV